MRYATLVSASTGPLRASCGIRWRTDTHSCDYMSSNGSASCSTGGGLRAGRCKGAPNCCISRSSALSLPCVCLPAVATASAAHVNVNQRRLRTLVLFVFYKNKYKYVKYNNTAGVSPYYLTLQAPALFPKTGMGKPCAASKPLMSVLTVSTMKQKG